MGLLDLTDVKSFDRKDKEYFDVISLSSRLKRKRKSAASNQE